MSLYPLIEASRDGREDQVRLLLNRGADVNTRDRNFNSALMLAADNGHENIVRLLLARDADVNARNEFDHSALILTAENGNETIVRLLIESGAGINSRTIDGHTALIIAAHNGHENVVRLLLDKGAEIDARNNIGSTALSVTATSGHESIARLLLDRGANVNNRSTLGNTPLMIATVMGHENVVRLLLNKGANVNESNNFGNTTLMLAVKKGLEDIVRLLLENGADVDARNNSGRTALSIAKEERNENIIKLLRSQLFPSKKRTTTDWMDICDSIGNARLSELRRIVRDGVKESNFQRVKKYFEYTESLQGFYSYVDSLSKKKLCVYLAKYYEETQLWLEICNVNGSRFEELKSLAKRMNLDIDVDSLDKEKLCEYLSKYFYGDSIHKDCINTDTFLGDDLYLLPPERIITLDQDGKKFCFDVLEVERLNRLNPYNTKVLPEQFILEARERVRHLPKDIHTLQQRAASIPVLEEEFKVLLNVADERVPYFPRRKFLLTNSKKLRRLVQYLSEFDPSFRVEDFNQTLEKDKLIGARHYILRRLVDNPPIGTLVNEFLLPIT